MLANKFSAYQPLDDSITVELSYSLVRLLSEQLYQSPLKAIEELVINSFDAEASECKVFVPKQAPRNFIAIYDNGIGMEYEGLVDLWQIGRSKKRDADVETRSNRKQIGKFGVGKLASYTIAEQLTYITKCDGQILAVTINFESFDPSQVDSTNHSIGEELSPAKIEPVHLEVYEIDGWHGVLDTMAPVFQALNLSTDILDNQESWTLALLENIKERGHSISVDRLRWVLSTAMPRQSDFELFLNNERVRSSKSEYDAIVEFSVAELPEFRLSELSEETGEYWYRKNDKLMTDFSFNEGVGGTIVVTRNTLTGGKSSDIGRSHGFFIRVRDRLINEDDPLFGLKPQVYGTFNRLDAQIDADNLDVVLTVARDSIESTDITQKFQSLLLHIFQEADGRYHRAPKDPNKSNKEGDKNIVEPLLVEYPIADALLTHNLNPQGPEADESWFYIAVTPSQDIHDLIQNLYAGPRQKYEYDYMKGKRSDRIVKFSPSEARFTLNESHEFIQENRGGTSRKLLEDFVTAEMLLEVYMRESHIPAHIIGNILEQRDKLLRSLARDRSTSLVRIAQALRDSSADEYELEINLVVAMRALGFTAKHIAGPENPDGVARYIKYPGGEKRLVLEAKSSQATPTLQSLGFDALKSHKLKHDASGCLLIAPSYPGESKGDESEASKRAQDAEISCWTIDNLAQVVESAEKRNLGATHIIDIVESCFTPDQVAKAIDKQMSTPRWDNWILYQGIIDALKSLQGRMPDRPRDMTQISTEISADDRFNSEDAEVFEKGVRDLAAVSQGGITISGQNIVLHVSPEELERRVESHIKPRTISPRRRSSFRNV